MYLLLALFLLVIAFLIIRYAIKWWLKNGNWGFEPLRGVTIGIGLFIGAIILLIKWFK